MDKYRPCPSIIAMFTSDSQHPPRSKHAVYLGVDGLQACLFKYITVAAFPIYALHGEDVAKRGVWRLCFK